MNEIIKLNAIISAPWNTRGEITAESVKDLAQSIKEQGLINPVTIWRDDTGAIVCIAGNRRLAALRLVFAADSDVSRHCTEFHGTEAQAKMITVVENLQRVDADPFEEARLVGECLDAEMRAETIAANTGRSVAWVNRRRKLLNLDEAWRKSGMPLDVLERVASYSPDIQARVARTMSVGLFQRLRTWSELRYYFDTATKDLGRAKFDKRPCATCLKRTGVEADLFGDIADGLGSCLDCACFDKNRESWLNKRVEAMTNGAKQVIKCDYSYLLPAGRESSDHLTDIYDCAYYFVSGWDIILRWSLAPVGDGDCEDVEEVEETPEQIAERERQKRLSQMKSRLDERFGSDADETTEEKVRGNVSKMLPKMSRDVADIIVDAVCESVIGWHSSGDWARLINAFDWMAEMAGLTSEEAEEYVVANLDREETEEE